MLQLFLLFPVISSPLACALEWADKVDGVSNAFLPFTGDFHARVVVVDDEESRGGQFKTVLLLKILCRPER